MKKIISIMLTILLLFCMCVTAFAAPYSKTYYIDSVNGDDSNNGTSVLSPWRSVENVKSLTLNPGDSILFKSDCIFTVEELELTCKGTQENPITISSYGEGEFPLLTTNKYSDILWLFDCSYLTVSNLEMTAHNGGAIWINTINEKSTGVTLDTLKIHDIQNYEHNARDNILFGAKEARACVMVKNIFSHNSNPVDDLTITNCEFYDCGNGISLWGGWNEAYDPFEEKASLDDLDFYYNDNALISNCYFHNMDAEALIMGICENSLVTNCRCIDCTLNDGIDENGNMTHVNAAMWFWGSQHCTIQNTEIAGQKCVGDGMAVDFDSRSNYCTYQYIYSHDNMRFIRCCSPECGQRGNTVRYCLSVNDNGGQNRLGTEGSVETDFRFYNNTIINSHSFVIDGVKNGYIANNIFVGDISRIFNVYQNKKEADGTVSKYAFSGEFVNNCIYGMAVPTVSENTIRKNPNFVGNDEANPESYRLSSDSPLLNKGICMGESGTDIFGNQFTDTVNIGCYMGEGVQEKPATSFGEKFIRFFSGIFATVYQFFYEIITYIFAF